MRPGEADGIPASASIPESSSPADVGVTDYAVGEEIGRGGMGSVFRATDGALQRDVALKSLTAEARHSHTAAARFEREARALAQLEHPNIVPIHQLGHDNEGRPFYTMKLVKGRTLKAILRAIKAGDPVTLAAFPLDRLLSIFRKVCDAIAFAHHQRTLHRDLKPENIMVGEYGEALVMDWGLAKFLDEDNGFEADSSPPGDDSFDGSPTESKSPLTSTGSSSSGGLTLVGEVFGTPNYMSPEQASGATEKIDARSDIFALGAMLYEILTLTPPVTGNSSIEVLKRIVAGDIVSPSARHKRIKPGDAETRATTQVRAPHCPGGRIPETLSAISMRALANRRRDRYQEVGALASDIDAWSGGFATSVENVGFVGQLRLLIRRHKAITATLAIALAALAWGASLFVIGMRAEQETADRERARAEASAQTATAAATKALAAEFNARAAHAQTTREFAKAQITLADVARRDRDVPRLIRLLEECPDEFRDTDWNYLHSKIDESNLAIDTGVPALQSLVGRRGKIPGFFGCSREALYFIQPDKGDFRRLDLLPDGASPLYHSLTISANGDRMALAFAPGSQALFIDARHKTVLRRIQLPRGQLKNMKLNHDGSRLLVSYAEQPRLRMLDTQSGKVVWSVGNSFPPIARDQVGSVACDPTGRYVAAFVMSATHDVHLFEAATGKPVRKMSGRPHFLWHLTFSPDGRHLAGGDYFGVAHVWKIRNGEQIARLSSGNARLHSLEFTLGGNLATLSGESVGHTHRNEDDRRWLDIWSPESGILLKQFLGVPGDTLRLAGDPDRALLLTAGKTLKFWSVPLKREMAIVRSSFAGGDLGFLGDKNLFTAFQRVSVGCYEIDGGKVQSTHKELRLSSRAVFSGDRRVMISGSKKITLVGGEPVAVEQEDWSRLGIQLDRVSLNQDGSRLLALEGSTMRVIDTDERRVLGKLQSVLPEQGATYVAAAFGSENQILAIRKNAIQEGETDTSLEWWREGSAEPEIILPAPTGQTTIQSNADGSLAAVADLGWRVTLYDSSDLKPIRRFRAHDELIRGIAFHPSRPILATASDDMSIKLWNYEADPPTLLTTILGPTESPMRVSFNASGTILASSGVERAARLWETETLLGKKD